MAATRRFGSSEDVRLAVGGNTAFVTGPFTAAVVVRQNTDNLEVDWLRGWTSGFAVLWTISSDTTTNKAVYNENATATRGLSPFTVTVADAWVIVVASKATGTATIAWSKYVFSTGTWTQGNDTNGAVGSSAAIGAGGTFQIATQATASVDVAGAAIWNVALSNAQVLTLANSWNQWRGLTPASMWVLDQASTATGITDLVGTSNQSSLTGTSISPNASPMGYAVPFSNQSHQQARSRATNF